MVEFIIVFVPLFTFFLCIVQMGLLYTASLGVQHAATQSVRSASVVMPDDPRAYDCLLYTSPSPRDATLSRMPSSA